MPAPAFGRVKRVTAPLDGRVGASLRGRDDGRLRRAHCSSSSSSCSEHEADDLSSFVDDGLFFFFSASGGDERLVPEPEGSRAVAENEPPAGECSFNLAVNAGMIRSLVNQGAAGSTSDDCFGRRLAADAAAVAAKLAGLRKCPSSFRRAMMGSLRDTGYDAGICRSRWERGGGGLVAGTYEYIDVLRSSSTSASPHRRYIVDVDFAGEFEIARPTEEYRGLEAELPRAFVGPPDGLRPLLVFMAEAMKRSLRQRGMHLPPWRSSRYVQAKWLGPYRRATDRLTSPPPPQPAGTLCHRRGDAACRLVGFDETAAEVGPPAGHGRLLGVARSSFRITSASIV